jgi:DNA-binding transcriptional LysR family regulator
MAAAGFGVILAPEHMPLLPTLKSIPLEGDPVSREVRLLAVQGRRYSPALEAFVKVARLRDWRSHGVKSWNVSSIRGEYAAHAFTAVTSKAA